MCSKVLWTVQINAEKACPQILVIPKHTASHAYKIH